MADAVSEAADPADFKILFAFFCDNFWINDPSLHFVRAVDCPGFINIPAVSSDPFFPASDIKFFKSKIGGQKPIFVLGLQMVIPANSSDILQNDQPIRPVVD